MKLPKVKGWREKLAKACFGITMALITSAIVFTINMTTGAFAASSLGQQLQDSIAREIASHLRGKMDPLRIYLQQGVRNFDEMGLDFSNWSDLQQTISYQRSFLESYFDESRCCSALFVNMHYDRDADGRDDVLKCHALEDPDCTGTRAGSLDGEVAGKDLGGQAVWAGVLHYSDTYTTGRYPGLDVCEGTCLGEHSGDFVQVLPAQLEGHPNNTLTFRYYEKKRSLQPWLGDAQINQTCVERDAAGVCTRQEDPYGNWVRPVGFVHWPIQDGYWYRDIQAYNLSKGEVRFATRVFPWTLYPPAVLKTHIFTPLYKEGVKVGGWVTGFKLHWITGYLSELAKPAGTFIFIVERHTGVLVSTSDPAIRVLKKYTTDASLADVVFATECPDVRVSGPARVLVQEGGATPRDWAKVGHYTGRPELQTTGESEEAFIIARDFSFLGLEWVVVINVPGRTILADINELRNVRLAAILGVTGTLKVLSALLLLGIQAAVARYVFAGQELSAAQDEEHGEKGEETGKGDNGDAWFDIEVFET
mmetsp:Transcript_29047/g.67316  ORF Transcript_29047/g.67316 Transcript_29047/m.67316 type:complete len:535 (-) Transcript_29047:207-1811(-)